MAESFVKALYDYYSNETGDLSFKAGAIIQVIDIIDDNWINGEYNGKVGLFPATFVEPAATVPVAKEKTVVAKETYISGEDGVLSFFRGDVVTFLGFVDDYWCQGSFAGEVGLFPAYAVAGLEELSESLTPTAAGETIIHKPVTEPSGAHVPPVNVPKPCAEALFEFKGLSDIELSFPAGKTIRLIKDVDPDWFEGSYNGRSGLFPKSFVKVLVPLIEEVHEDVQETCIPYAVAVYPFVGETTTELSFREGEVILLHYWVSPEWIQGECNGKTGIFPSSFVQIHVELSETFQESPESNNEWEDRNGLMDVDTMDESLFKIGDKALAIYNFATNTEGDLSFEVGDVITIVEIIDDEWVVGQKNDGEVGLCPSVFLELPGDTSESVGSKVNWVSSFESTQNNSSLVVSMQDMLSSEPTRNLEDFESPSDTGRNEVEQNIVNGEGLGLLPNGTSCGNPTLMFTTCEVAHHGDGTSSSVASSEPISISTDMVSHGKQVSIETKSNKRPAPKPPLAAKPTILPKPDFLKKTVKPDLAQKHVDNNRQKPVSVTSTIISQKPVVPARRKVNERQEIFGGSVTGIVVKADGQDKSPSPGKPPPRSILNSSIPSTSRTLEESYNMSFKNLLGKSVEDLSVQRETSPPRTPPIPPPRLDLLSNKPFHVITSEALSEKLAQQAEEFRSSSRKNSPSLNELQLTSQKSGNVRPVPAKRTKLPQPNKSDIGFPILIDLDEQITQLNNELEKETKVLTGTGVLIEVQKNTSRKEELESKKVITERKIEDLKRQLNEVEDQKKNLEKLFVGYSSELEIKLKIEQLQDGIKENVDTRNNLQSLLNDSHDEELRNELQDNVLFCDQAIKNLQAELHPLLDLMDKLKGKAPEKSPVQREKDVMLRKKVIDEILQTEKSFGSDLNLCVKHFMMQLINWKVEAIDCDLLFGNMPEVAAFSSKLLNKLEAATANVNINNQIIGTCFVDLSEEITAVYGRYCRNHDDAIAFLEKSVSNEEIQQHFKKCLESIREFSNCWDLSSFLIKPVQRILKYPLLLNELLKNTPDDHPDKKGLIKALEVMTTAANDVNEFKRRKDLVQKYQKVEESGLSNKFHKFTWHSVVKKSTRLNQRITQFTGLVSQTVDEKFNEKEKIFYLIEKTLKNFVKNITQYLEQFEEVQANQVQTAENIVDFYQENANAKEVQEYHAAQKYIGENLFNELKFVLDVEVLSPLNNLIQLFQGPHRLIQKRHDKCLDYDSWSNKIEKIKDREKWKQAKEELEFAKKNYEALNAQLLDELPIFNKKSQVFLQACIINFAAIHKKFFAKALDQFSPSLQLSVVNSESSGVVSDFLSQSKLVSHEVFQLSFTPSKSLLGTKPVRPSASPKAMRALLSPEERPFRTKSLKRSSSESKRKAPLPPSESGGLVRSHTVSVSNRSLVKGRELGSELNPSITGRPRSNSDNAVYVVMFTFNAEAQSELSVNKDDVVRVIQFHDNFGNNEWWKVERDDRTGYVPASYLARHTKSSVVFKSVSSNGGLPESSALYNVRYDFKAQGPTEVNVAAGDIVRVFEKHDPSGYHEWWSVEVNGKRGYVPASYLERRY